MRAFIACIIVLLVCMNVSAEPVQWSANGHFYEAVIVPGGITWSDARAAAIAAGGDLATITSPEENQFVFGLIDDSSYWIHPGGWYGPWIGGYQTPQFPVGIENPAADWHWVNEEVTGEVWSYTNWSACEPDDSNGQEQNRLFYDAPYDSPTWATKTWGDKIDGGDSSLLPISYVVEYVPEPCTFILLLAGVISMLAYVWRRRKSAA